MLFRDTMFASEFKPLDKLDELHATAREMPEAHNRDGAYLWMCNNESLALFELLDELEAGYEKLFKQLTSVRSFFDADFFARLHQYGQHPDTNFRMEAVSTKASLCSCTKTACQVSAGPSCPLSPAHLALSGRAWSDKQ